GYLTSTRTPMIISGLTSAIPSFLWTSGFLLPPLASSLLHYLSAQHRNHLSPLVCTSAAGKQITNHSLDISHCLRSTRTSHSSPLADHSPAPKPPGLPVLLFRSGPEFPLIAWTAKELFSQLVPYLRRNNIPLNRLLWLLIEMEEKYNW
ncbi:hypothetical protein XENOCAPTIV_009924, partial [Xenoophorus captivus]